MENTAEAFKWIIGILKEHNIPFQITGGLAAKVYGSSRELFDIDIDIPDNRLQDVVSEVKEYIQFGPARYQDDYWDLLLLILNYKGQRIDLSGISARIFDQNTKQWVEIRTDFSKYETKNIFGVLVPVIQKEDLIEYKSKLMRPEDKIDIEEMIRPPKN